MIREDAKYYKIKTIMSETEGLEVHERRGGSFHFPIYLTDSMASTSIEALELSVRSNNCLRRAGIMSIGDLCERVQSSEDLKGIRNCGSKSISEIMDHLFAYQYAQLRPERKRWFFETIVKMNFS